MHYRLDLTSEDRLLPTPSGAYHAVCTEQPKRVRGLLFALMEKGAGQYISPGALAARLEETEDETLDLLHTLQTLGFIEAGADTCGALSGPLEKVLPPLLLPLSSSGKALLSDNQGLYIANVGFTHETAEELSALGADLAALHGRHRYLISRNLGLHTEAWGLLDASGGSRIGFWPLHIGETEFNLVIADVPYLNQPAFRDLVWTLSQRYAQSK